MKKNILLSGCSFTQSRFEERQEWINSNRSWIPYSDLLYNEFNLKHNIKNVGRCSWSNGVIFNSIMKELFTNNFNYDFVIVQWSAVMRGFSYNNEEFVNRTGGGMKELFPFVHEYMIRNNMSLHEVTDTNIAINSEYYLTTLFTIYALQQILTSNNIPYFMFWGWKQITPKIYKEHKNIFDKIYNNNFWTYKSNGGMNEYCLSKLGKKAILSNDFHPTTESHKIFYDNIIKPLIINL